MQQRDLFGVHALCTGIVITYSIDWTEDTATGLFNATPTWSKRPRKIGDVNVFVDESTFDCVPDMAYHALRGVSRTDPADYVPYYVKRQLKNYQRASQHQPQ